MKLLKNFGRYRAWDILHQDGDSFYRRDYKELWNDWEYHDFNTPQWIPKDAIKLDRLLLDTLWDGYQPIFEHIIF